MASWAKNQIIKHLARFTKNLSPDNISLKFLKGEGELTNLELNEELLTELLQLPGWVSLTRATCNRICAKIPWTGFKTEPIKLYLDTVSLDMAISFDQKRKKYSSVASLSEVTREKPPASYGFTEKVFDGIYVSINSINITLTSPVVVATCHIARVIIESTDCHWLGGVELRRTRIKDEMRGLILLFKKISFQALRLDCNATSQNLNNPDLTPIRLITGPTSVLLTLKKQLSTSSLLATQMEWVFDELLCVLSDKQLESVSSLAERIALFNSMDLSNISMLSEDSDHDPVQWSSVASNPVEKSFRSSRDPLFDQFNLYETSFHCSISRVDLHICEDTYSDSSPKLSGDKSKGNWGGSSKVIVEQVYVDHYPYHKSRHSRSSWPLYHSFTVKRNQWAQHLLDNFIMQMDAVNMTSTGESSTLFESCVMLRCAAFHVLPICTLDERSSASKSAPFITSNLSGSRSTCSLDGRMFCVADYTTYFRLPVPGMKLAMPPPPTFYANFEPLEVNVDADSVLWWHRIMQRVLRGIEWTEEYFKPSDDQWHRLECLFNLESILVNIPTGAGVGGDAMSGSVPEDVFSIEARNCVATNTRYGRGCSRSDLIKAMSSAVDRRWMRGSTVYPNKMQDVLFFDMKRFLVDDALEYVSSFTSKVPANACVVWSVSASRVSVTVHSGVESTLLEPIGLSVWISSRLRFPQMPKHRSSQSLNSVGHDSGLHGSNAVQPDSYLRKAKRVMDSSKPDHIAQSHCPGSSVLEKACFAFGSTGGLGESQESLGDSQQEDLQVLISVDSEPIVTVSRHGYLSLLRVVDLVSKLLEIMEENLRPTSDHREEQLTLTMGLPEVSHLTFLLGNSDPDPLKARATGFAGNSAEAKMSGATCIQNGPPADACSTLLTMISSDSSSPSDPTQTCFGFIKSNPPANNSPGMLSLRLHAISVLMESHPGRQLIKLTVNDALVDGHLGCPHSVGNESPRIQVRVEKQCFSSRSLASPSLMFVDGIVQGLMIFASKEQLSGLGELLQADLDSAVVPVSILIKSVRLNIMDPPLSVIINAQVDVDNNGVITVNSTEPVHGELIPYISDGTYANVPCPPNDGQNRNGLLQSRISALEDERDSLLRIIRNLEQEIIAGSGKEPSSRVEHSQKQKTGRGHHHV